MQVGGSPLFGARGATQRDRYGLQRWCPLFFSCLFFLADEASHPVFMCVP